MVVGDGWVPQVFCPALILEQLRHFSSLGVLPAQSSSPRPVCVKWRGDIDLVDLLFCTEADIHGGARSAEGRERQLRV
jgi:hypothetical protein